MQKFKMKTITNLTIFFGLLSITNVHAQYEYERYQRHQLAEAEAPQIQTEEEATPQPPTVQDKRVLVPSLKGLIIAGEGRMPPEYVVRSTRGVEFYRSMQSIAEGDREALRRCLEKQFLEEVITFETLEMMKRDISRFYRKNGQALVMVSIPEQDVTDGVVTIVVVESRLGVVNILGSCWFPCELYRCAIGADGGDIIYNRSIEGDIAWLNRSNWRKVNAIYKPGREIGTTDIDIIVRDERPFNAYIGADNTGFKVTDETRLFFGFQWGNVFGWDHTLVYQSTFNPTWSKFWAQTLHYTAPIPCLRHVLVLFGGYSHTKAKNCFLPANVHSGKSWQVSGRYVIPQLPLRAFLQDWEVGVDWKRTNTDLVIGRRPVSKTNATILQLVGAWKGRADFCNNHIRTDVEVYLQPWTFGHTMTHRAYNPLRPGAALHYLYVNAFLHYLWNDPRTLMGLDIKLRGQVTSAPLLPIEMLGLGGVYSVRGYEERAVNVDNGVIFNFEVRLPKWAIFGRMRSFAGSDDGLSFIAFFDMGAGHLRKAISAEKIASVNSPQPCCPPEPCNTGGDGQPSDYFLAGIGPGFRYDMGHSLHARFDIGFRLTGRQFGTLSNNNVRLHWGVVAAY